MTAADNIRAYLEVNAALRAWDDSDLIDWVVDDTHAEHDLTVTDLRELLAENASLRAQDHEGQLRVAEAYRDAFGLRPWEEKQMRFDTASRRDAK